MIDFKYTVNIANLISYKTLIIIIEQYLNLYRKFIFIFTYVQIFVLSSRLVEIKFVIIHSIKDFQNIKNRFQTIQNI